MGGGSEGVLEVGSVWRGPGVVWGHPGAGGTGGAGGFRGVGGGDGGGDLGGLKVSPGLRGGCSRGSLPSVEGGGFPGRGGSWGGGLTSVEGGGAVQVPPHEARLRLLPHRVIPHPPDPALGRGRSWEPPRDTPSREPPHTLRIQPPPPPPRHPHCPQHPITPPRTPVSPNLLTTWDHTRPPPQHPPPPPPPPAIPAPSPRVLSPLPDSPLPKPHHYCKPPLTPPHLDPPSSTLQIPPNGCSTPSPHPHVPPQPLPQRSITHCWREAGCRGEVCLGAVGAVGGSRGGDGGGPHLGAAVVAGVGADG